MVSHLDSSATPRIWTKERNAKGKYQRNVHKEEDATGENLTIGNREGKKWGSNGQTYV